MLFSFLSFTQNISFILLIVFWILAQLPLTVFAANMWYTLVIFSLTILIIGKKRPNFRSYVLKRKAVCLRA